MRITMDSFPQLKDGFQLYNYQKTCVEWLFQQVENKRFGMKGCILALPMGLGKTLVTLEFIVRNMVKNRPSLVIATKTVMVEWKAQIEKFYGDSMSVLYLHSDYMNVSLLTRDMVLRKGIQLVVTTYDVVLNAAKRTGAIHNACVYGGGKKIGKRVVSIRPIGKGEIINENLGGTNFLFAIPWNIVVCDEAQEIRNSKTQKCRGVMGIYGEFKICLSGTLIVNYDDDLWSLFRWIGYTKITSATAWKRRGKRLFYEDMLRDKIFSKTYDDVGVKIPEKLVIRVKIDMTPKQLECYQKVLGQLQDAYEDWVWGKVRGKITYIYILVMVLRLRQICVCPHLIMSNVDGRAVEANKALIQESKFRKWLLNMRGTAGLNSPKIQILMKFYEERVKPGEKIIVYSTFVGTLDLAKEVFEKKYGEDSAVLITGQITGKARFETIEAFRDDEKYLALFMNFKVGAYGLNLQFVSNIFCLDPWWNESTHQQAIARCWRMGQEHNVRVFWLYMSQSIEEIIVDICNYKNELSHCLFIGTEYQGEKPELNRRMIGVMINKAFKMLGAREVKIDSLPQS